MVWLLLDKTIYSWCVAHIAICVSDGLDRLVVVFVVAVVVCYGFCLHLQFAHHSFRFLLRMVFRGLRMVCVRCPAPSSFLLSFSSFAKSKFDYLDCCLACAPRLNAEISQLICKRTIFISTSITIYGHGARPCLDHSVRLSLFTQKYNNVFRFSFFSRILFFSIPYLQHYDVFFFLFVLRCCLLLFWLACQTFNYCLSEYYFFVSQIGQRL